MDCYSNHLTIFIRIQPVVSLYSNVSKYCACQRLSNKFPQRFFKHLLLNYTINYSWEPFCNFPYVVFEYYPENPRMLSGLLSGSFKNSFMEFQKLFKQDSSEEFSSTTFLISPHIAKIIEQRFLKKFVVQFLSIFFKNLYLTMQGQQSVRQNLKRKF